MARWLNVSRRGWACVLPAAAIGLSRFWALGSDAPAWMPGAWLVDAGWWANGARGAVLFGDALSQDFGMAALMVPGYNWALLPLYRRFGVDIVWGEALAATANVLSIALAALIVWRKLGGRAALWVAILLGASPFYWAYGRAALPESLQALLVLVAFAAWMLGGRRPVWAFAGGMAMGAAILVKLNAATLGLVPLVLAWLAVSLMTRRGHASDWRATMSGALSATVGLTLVGIAGVVLVVVPHWDAFWTMLATESRARDVAWLRKLTFPGYALISDGLPENERVLPVLWKVARWSPGVMLALWLYLVDALRGWRNLARRDRFELVCLAWAMLAWGAILVGLNQWEYRYLLVMPIFGMLGAMHLARPAEELENPSTQPSGGLYGWLLWLVVLLPVFILVKAPLTYWVMGVSENLQVAGRPGLGTGAAGTPVAVAWLLLMAALIPLRGWAEKAAECLCRARARWAIAVVVALEAATVAFYLATAEDTLRRGLPAFQEHVAAGETVAGRLSATLFHSRPVHTVRSASPESDPDEFDWAAVRERYHPRYVALVETTGGVRDMDYTLILEELRNDGYRPAARMEVGPMLRRGPRYAFVLFERGTDE